MHLDLNLILNYRYISQYHAMSYKLDFLMFFAHAHGKCVGRRVKSGRALLWDNLL